MALAGAQQAGLADGIVLHGDSDTRIVPFVENGIRFEADVLQGQKTGFFLDQRENRARVEHLAAGRAQVLNVFAYSGGFSVYAARGGAAQVTSVDLSRPALIAAERHFALNSGSAAVARARHITIASDAFVELSKMEAARQRFDLVIIDPPSFAKTAEECDKALAAYRKLTRLGLAVLRSGGVLVQSSCSSHVASDTFYATILAAARGASRPLRELERTGHPVDHPIGFPEGAYLKTLFAIAPCEPSTTPPSQIGRPGSLSGNRAGIDFVGEGMIALPQSAFGVHSQAPCPDREREEQFPRSLLRQVCGRREDRESPRPARRERRSGGCGKSDRRKPAPVRAPTVPSARRQEGNASRRSRAARRP